MFIVLIIIILIDILLLPTRAIRAAWEHVSAPLRVHVYFALVSTLLHRRVKFALGLPRNQLSCRLPRVSYCVITSHVTT